MDIEIIKALANLPLDFVLIYLIVKQQAQINMLLERIGASEREHLDSLVRILCRGSLGDNDRNVDK